MTTAIPKLRSIILLFALLFLLTCSASAEERGAWSLMPHVGVQGSNVVTNGTLYPGILIGYRAGLLGEWAFSRGLLGRISLASGIEVTSKGRSFSADAPYPIVQSHALDVPLLLGLTVHLTRVVDVTLQGGAYAGYSFRNSKEHFPEGHWQAQQSVRQRPFFCPYDYGARFGISIEARRLVWHMGATLSRYDFYIDRHSGKRPFHLSHRTLFTTLGYRF